MFLKTIFWLSWCFCWCVDAVLMMLCPTAIAVDDDIDDEKYLATIVAITLLGNCCDYDGVLFLLCFYINFWVVMVLSLLC